jgi:hypothetical protein
VEVGPRNVLTGLTEQILANRPALIVTADQKERSGILQLHHLLGRLAAEGVPINPERFYSGRTVRQLNLNALEKETGQPELSPTTWLVNGSRAKPLRDASKPDEIISPVRLVVADDEKSIAAMTESTVGNQRMNPLDSRQKVQKQIPDELSEEQPLPETPARMNVDAAKSDSSEYRTAKSRFSEAINVQKSDARNVDNTNHSSDAVAVMSQFQQMMNRFLETQKNVMLTYIQQTSDGAKPSVDAVPETPSLRSREVKASGELPVGRREMQTEVDMVSFAAERVQKTVTPIVSQVPSEPNVEEMPVS